MRRHPAAAVEDTFNSVLGRGLRRRGWRPVVLAYAGYGNADMLRVLARVVLVPAGHHLVTARPRVDADVEDRRGWRSFFSAPAPLVEVRLRVPDASRVGGDPDDETDGDSDGEPDGGWPATTDRGGYLDVRIPNPQLGPGWQRVVIEVAGTTSVAMVLVVGGEQRFGLVSDIDDTVIRTRLPRPLIAFYNTFVLREQSRRPVPGMAELYRDLVARQPGSPVVYVSTGAWNTEATLRRFLRRNGFPDGPLLLTDWGPTHTGWFRSGPEHKRSCLAALAADLPRISWLLIGDDGQHDPGLYADFAQAHPDRVRAVAIRRLSPAEQVLAHGTVTERSGQDSASVPVPAEEVRAPDGAGLARELARLGLL